MKGKHGYCFADTRWHWQDIKFVEFSGIVYFCGNVQKGKTWSCSKSKQITFYSVTVNQGLLYKKQTIITISEIFIMFI